jgi:hypothetical protein
MKSLLRFLSFLLLLGCAGDQVAGKSTTTGNGLLPLDESGRVVMGVAARGAHGWDSVAQRPTDTVRLVQRADGWIDLQGDAWAFVELRDSSGLRGSLVRRVADGTTLELPLQAPISLQARWLDHATFPGSRAIAESTFAAVPLDESGTWAIEGFVPEGTRLGFATPSGAFLTAGRLRGDSLEDISLNLSRPTAPLPLLLDDFEGSPSIPRLAQAWPGTSRWRLFPRVATLLDPSGTDSLSVRSAIRTEAGRLGHFLSFSFQADSAASYVAAQVSFPAMDLRERRSLCFQYRSDRRVKVELLGPDTSTGAPGFSLYVPPTASWEDTCVALSDLMAQPQNTAPNSTWAGFAGRVRVVQFLATSGSSYLGLDDIVFDRR